MHILQIKKEIKLPFKNHNVNFQKCLVWSHTSLAAVSNYIIISAMALMRVLSLFLPLSQVSAAGHCITENAVRV